MPAIKISASLRRELKQVAVNSKGFQDAARKVATDAFKEIESQFMQEFESHPITREIEGGSNSSNISGTLNGYGNLFGFIGFSQGSDPIAQLRTMLKSMMKMNQRAKTTKGSNPRVGFDVSVPDMKVIMSATPMPWENGRSWVRGIERGISGFGYFMNTMDRRYSRSGAGIQVDEKLRPGSYTPTKYMSEMLRNLDKKFRILVR